MLHLSNRTFLQQVMEAEKNIFLSERIDEIKSVSTKDDFVGGNVLYRIPINRTSTKDLIDNNTYPLKRKDNRVVFYSSNSFMRKVTGQVINISPQKGIKACLEVIYKYKKAAGASFYGAVLRKDRGDVIINPFHILSAVSLLDSKELMEDSYSISIYFYANRQSCDEYYKSDYACSESIKSNIDSLLLSYVNRVNTEIKVTSKGTMDYNGVVAVSYKEKKHEDEDSRNTHYIVTHQIATQGIIIPYYGTSIIEKQSDGSSSKGIHVSPMRSCNISQDSELVPENTQSYRNVCTGGLDNTTLDGLRSLTHSNLSSPYNSDNLMPGFMVYADTMVERSLELYAKAGIITYTPQEEMCPYTDSELTCETLREFLILLNFGKKRKVKPAEAEDRFNEIQIYKMKKEAQNEQEEQTSQEDHPA